MSLNNLLSFPFHSLIATKILLSLRYHFPFNIMFPLSVYSFVKGFDNGRALGLEKGK